ncbi:UNVERIFIED_ORG: hypothetical protein B2H93_13975 [Clostridium botulinum]
MFNELNIIFKILFELAQKRRKIQEKYGWKGDINTYLDFNKTKNGILVNQATEELENFLNALDFEVVKTIQTIMYLGRDKDYENDIPIDRFKKVKKGLIWNNQKSIEVNQIVSKLPLDKYLEEGFKILGIKIN